MFVGLASRLIAGEPDRFNDRDQPWIAIHRFATGTLSGSRGSAGGSVQDPDGIFPGVPADLTELVQNACLRAPVALAVALPDGRGGPLQLGRG